MVVPALPGVGHAYCKGSVCPWIASYLLSLSNGSLPLSSNQWHRFIEKHGDKNTPAGPFVLFLDQKDKRAVWRIRLSEHKEFEEVWALVGTNSQAAVGGYSLCNQFLCRLFLSHV